MIKNARHVACDWDPDMLAINRRLFANMLTEDRLALVARIRELPGAMAAHLVADELEREVREAGE